MPRAFATWNLIFRTFGTLLTRDEIRESGMFQKFRPLHLDISPSLNCVYGASSSIPDSCVSRLCAGDLLCN